MPTSLAGHVKAILDDWPVPATVVATIVVLALGLFAGAVMFPPPQPVGPSQPAAAITITPDDPAAPAPVAAQLLGR